MNFFLLIFLFNIKIKNGNLERYFGDYSNAGCKWTGDYDILQMDKTSRIVFAEVQRLNHKTFHTNRVVWCKLYSEFTHKTYVRDFDYISGDISPKYLGCDADNSSLEIRNIRECQLGNSFKIGGNHRIILVVDDKFFWDIVLKVRASLVKEVVYVWLKK